MERENLGEDLVVMSKTGGLTSEEHRILDAIYDCIINGNCNLYNLLLQINQTTSNTFDLLRRTDQSVVANETQTTFVVDGSSDLEINYTINIPKKSGYGLVADIQGFDDFLPMRLNYWFVNNESKRCVNQAVTNASALTPACNPLVAQTIGQIETQINFTVKMKPSLPPGNYTIIRNLEIDPDRIWLNYGQEPIGTVQVLETVGTPSVEVITTGSTILQLAGSAITGALTAGIGSAAIGGLIIVLIVSVGLSVYFFIFRKKRH